MDALPDIALILLILLCFGASALLVRFCASQLEQGGKS